GLVVVQIALSVVLLLGSGLLLRTFYKLLAVPPGFDTARVLKFGIGVPEKRYNTDLKLIDFHHRLLDRLRAIPAVAAVGMGQRLPLRGGTVGVGGSFQIAGAGIPLPQRPRAWTNCVSPEYFAALHIPLLAGRTFSWDQDRPGMHRAAIVNDAFRRA